MTDNVVKFRVGTHIFEIVRSKIPINSYLSTLLITNMHVEKEDNIYSLSDNDDDIPLYSDLFSYLTENRFPPITSLSLLDYLGIDPASHYEMALQGELDMRKNMYHRNYEHHPMNIDPHYGLIKLTKELWDQINIKVPNYNNLLFTTKTLRKRSWDDIQTTLKTLASLSALDNYLIAGDYMFTTLFSTTQKDVGIFFYSMVSSVAESNIYKLVDIMGYNDQNLKRYYDDTFGIMLYADGNKYCDGPIKYFNNLAKYYDNSDLAALDNAAAKINIITITDVLRAQLPYVRTGTLIEGRYITKAMAENITKAYHNPCRNINIKRTNTDIVIGDYHVNTRLYRTPSEILHSFAIDCCGIGYDGTDIWLTQRAYHALSNGVNYVNFELYSKDYELQLSKYGLQGMAVHIPNFDKNKINHVSLRKCGNGTSIDYHGLDILIWLDYKMATDPSHDIWNNRDRFTTFPISHIVYGCYPIEIIENAQKLYPNLKSLMSIYDDILVNNSREDPVNIIRLESLYENNIVIRDYVNELLHINPVIYNFLAAIRTWTFPADLAWDNNNFSGTVLDDNNKWYRGLFY